MKNNNVSRIFSVCLLLLLIPAVVFPAGIEKSVPMEDDLARVRKKVEALRAWQLTEELDLDQETIAKLFPAMKEADDDRWRIESDNRALTRKMNRLMEKKRPDPDGLNRLLDQLQSNGMELARVEDRHLTKIRSILSPEDSVRYLMFQIRFQRELREKAAYAFREGRGLSDGDSERSRSGSDSGEGKSGGNGSSSGSGAGKR
jgi:septal ring factor EnvC (AmiA/AmiB activator)